MAGYQKKAFPKELMLALSPGGSPPSTPSPLACTPSPQPCSPSPQGPLPMKVALLSELISGGSPAKLPAKTLRLSGEDAPEIMSPSPVLAGLAPPPGLPLPVGTPSHGSSLHQAGKCKPCAWFWKPNGCQNGKDCLHCHICPDGEIKARKKTRQAMMRLGLATPKTTESSSTDNDLDPFSLFSSDLMVSLGAVEQESTTCSGSDRGSVSFASDQDLSGGTFEHESAGSEQDASEQVPTASSSAVREVAFPPGLKAPPNTPSHGSALHGMGNCRPCAWFWKPSGCQNARNCKFCHLCSDGELKSRKKSKHTMMKLGIVTPKATSAHEAKYALNLAALF